MLDESIGAVLNGVAVLDEPGGFIPRLAGKAENEQQYGGENDE